MMREGAPRGARRGFVIALGCYTLWVVVSLLRDGALDDRAGGYLIPPLSIGAGALLGLHCARWRDRLFVPAAASALALSLVFVLPIYPNAAAAAGTQLVAVGGLLLMAPEDERRRPRFPTAHLLLSVVTGALGVLLAARAQAASLLVLPVVVVIALSLWGGPRPSRRVTLIAGIGTVGAAASAVVVLGSASHWPSWMESGESLSRARRDLWRDALAQWRERPLLGGGPGSFSAASDTARSEPHLYAAHSSLLQVASELGLVGVMLFCSVLVAGALLAVSGSRAPGLVATTAWCALAIHSMIDHLYEFPIVCLLAGLVIAWAEPRERVR